MRRILLLIIILFLKSCGGSESDEGDTAVTYLTIMSEGGNEKILGKAFLFKVKDNIGHDITSECKIYVNGELISGNVFIPAEKGIYTVLAAYNNLPVNPISVQAVLNEGVSFKHRILYEDFTGTWCGYCTIAQARHDNLKLQTEDFVFIGIHGPSGTSDPWSNSTSTAMENLKNISEWPAMYINRNMIWLYNSNYTDISLPLSQLNAYSKIGIKINSSLSGNTANIAAKIFFTGNYNNLKMVSLIVEDNLVNNQKNYISTLYGGAGTVYNFVHHNVLRDKLTGSIEGEPIPDSQTVISNEYSKKFQYSAKSDYNLNNLKVVLMILDENGKVLNVREEKLGSSNNYEYL